VIVKDDSEIQMLLGMSKVARLQWALEAAGKLADLAPLLHVSVADLSEGLKRLDKARIEYNRRITTIFRVEQKEKESGSNRCHLELRKSKKLKTE